MGGIIERMQYSNRKPPKFFEHELHESDELYSCHSRYSCSSKVVVAKVYFAENGNNYEVYLRILCPSECSILLSTTISIQEPHQ